MDTYFIVFYNDFIYFTSCRLIRTKNFQHFQEGILALILIYQKLLLGEDEITIKSDRDRKLKVFF